MSKINFDKNLGILKTVAKHATKNLAKYPVISKCPVCHGDLVVTELECTNCETKIQGSFTLSKFNYLDTEKLYFIEIFVKNRGNIKMVEKEMGLSYPTIKKMLEEVIEQLGYSSTSVEDEQDKKYTGPSKKEILDKIGSGELSVEEATKLLSKIK